MLKEFAHEFDDWSIFYLSSNCHVLTFGNNHDCFPVNVNDAIRFGVFNVNFENISHLFLVFLMLTLSK